MAETNANRGAQLKLTPEVQTAIVNAIAKGSPRKFAAEAAGVSERAVCYWMAQGRRGSGDVFVAFVAAVKKAEADAVVTRVGRLDAAGEGGAILERTTTTRPDGTEIVTEKYARPEWTADAWVLERRHPDHFAANRKKDIEDAVAKALERVLANGAQPVHTERDSAATQPPGSEAGLASDPRRDPPRPDAPDAAGGDGPGPVAGGVDPV